MGPWPLEPICTYWAHLGPRGPFVITKANLVSTENISGVPNPSVVFGDHQNYSWGLIARIVLGVAKPSFGNRPTSFGGSTKLLSATQG